ncbi:MAG TPA: YhjD/YihY/BrkB family envelope integrity protein [Steroidobacteraceae bacterium]|nr:YhjD/YihY/BrkB family envelope integrity protein [Steroidobacteraceae bacterium]
MTAADWIWDHIEAPFFGPASERRSLRGVALRLARYPYAIVRELLRGQINLRAMGLVFATLLSLVPLVALSFSLLKLLGMHRSLEPIVYEFFRPAGAGAAQLSTSVVHFAHRLRTGFVGGIGLALFAWTLIGTLKKAEDSINFVWRVDRPRNLARRMTGYVALLVIGPILVAAVIGLTHAALTSEPARVVTQLPLTRRMLQLAFRFAPYAVVTAFFTLLYIFVPNTHVRLRPALIAGLCAGIAWATIGRVFTELVEHSARLTVVYAGFAVIIAVLMWTYLGWVILLTGAQLAFYLQYPAYLRLGSSEAALSTAEQEQLALKVMVLVGEAQLKGAAHVSIDSVAATLQLPGLAVARAATALEQARLLSVQGNGELALARDPDQIGTLAILDAARGPPSGRFKLPEVHVPAAEELATRLEEARQKCCGAHSLRELLE